MRHRVFGKKLGRNYNERKALFRSLVKSMFTYGSINTTQAKAQAVVSTVEKLSTIIISKPDLIARRELYRILQDRHWVNNVVETFKTVFGEQTSNFTKLTKIKYRQGDNSLIVKLSFVKPIVFDPKNTKVKEIKEVKKVKETKEVKKTKKVSPKATKTTKKGTKRSKNE